MTGAISNEDYLKIKLKRAHFIAERTLRCIQILISGLKNTVEPLNKRHANKRKPGNSRKFSKDQLFIK